MITDVSDSRENDYKETKMKILGIDSSGMTATVALIEDDVTLAEYSVNYKRTHSETLMPMLDDIVKATETDLSEIDAIAIAAGPGSFTGLRIGAATVKGLGLALEKPVIAVPTCEGLAMNLWGNDGLICPIIDARRNQVYTGIYRIKSDNGNFSLEVVMDQTALDINELIDILNEKNESVSFNGDGVKLFRDTLAEKLTVPYSFAPAMASRQRASSVAALGLEYFRRGENNTDAKVTDADSFTPVYLRKSQAERVRDEGR